MRKYNLTDWLLFGWTSQQRVKNMRSKEDRAIAGYIRPTMAPFFVNTAAISQRAMIEQLWDQTAITANDLWARGVYSMTHADSIDWFSYEAPKHLKGDQETVEWTRRVNADLTEQFRENGFYFAVLNRLYDVGSFGSAATYSPPDGESGEVSFEYVPYSECFYTIGKKGLCESFWRPLNLTVFEAVERGFDLNRMHQRIRDAWERNDQATKFKFLHIVHPRAVLKKYASEIEAEQDHEFVGFYLDVLNRSILEQHGFFTHPYNVLCGQPVPSNTYPMGIGYMTLPEIRNINGARKKFDRILDNESDSPVLASRSGEQERRPRPRSGEFLYGGMNGDGRRLMDLLYNQTHGTRIVREEVQTSREIIQEAWSNHLMLMIANGTMTAHEVVSRDEKIIQAMGPMIVPMMADLRRQIDRTFDARMRAGVYDPLPSAFDADTILGVKLNGVLAKAAAKLEASGIVSLYTEAIGTIGQLGDEGIATVNRGLDHNAALRKLAEARAVDIAVPQQEVEGQLAADQEAAEAQEQMATMPEIARAAKDGAQAQEIMERTSNGSQSQGIGLAP